MSHGTLDNNISAKSSWKNITKTGALFYIYLFLVETFSLNQNITPQAIFVPSRWFSGFRSRLQHSHVLFFPINFEKKHEKKKNKELKLFQDEFKTKKNVENWKGENLVLTLYVRTE